MYSYLTSCLLQWCPQGAMIIPIRRNYPPYSDEDFEKYEPRPKIVIDAEVESIKSFVSESIVSFDSGAQRLRILAQYSAPKRTVIVKIMCLLNMESSDEDETTSIRLSLGCAKVVKQQTTHVSGSNPVYGETFSFSHVDEDDLLSTSIRFRVYRRKGRGRASLRAECRLQGDMITKEGAKQYSLPLNTIETVKSEITSGLSPSMHRVSNGNVNGDSRRSSMVDSCGRFCSQPMNDAPELLVSLCYDCEHSCVTVGIERGSQFGEKQKPPDTFIKIVSFGEFGNELSRQKTELVKGTSEPTYDHQSSIQLHRNDLDTTTVRVEVWQSVGVLRRRQMMGWLAVGLNSSSPDAQEHWEQMIQGQGIAVSKWHPLQPPE